MSLLDPLDPLAPSAETYSRSAPTGSTLDNLFGGSSLAEIAGGTGKFSSPAKQGSSSTMFGAPSVTSSSMGGFGMSASSGSMPMMMGSPHTPRHVMADGAGVDQPITGMTAADSGFFDVTFFR